MERIKAIFSKQNRALLSELVRTDFKLRYQGSVLGYAWSLLRPLMLFGILYAIFALAVKTGGNIPHFPVYLLLGIILWTFFTDMTSQSLGSIVGRGDLIRKIRIPRWIIVLSSSISALISLGLNLIVFVVVAALSHIDPIKSMFYLPLLLIELYVFALGISLFLSAAFVKFRDLSFIWEVLVQMGFYLTPILYAMSLLPERFQKIQLLSPVAQVMQDARHDLISHDPSIITGHQLFGDSLYTYIPFALVVIVFISGFAYFKSQADSFAENI